MTTDEAAQILHANALVEAARREGREEAAEALETVARLAMQLGEAADTAEPRDDDTAVAHYVEARICRDVRDAIRALNAPKSEPQA